MMTGSQRKLAARPRYSRKFLPKRDILNFMQDLTVIGVENGALLALAEDGERFRIPVDEVLQSRLRLGRVNSNKTPKITPREIQQHIRAGLSAEDVAELTGAALEYVERFEGPIIAEREHMVAQALAVTVRVGGEVDLFGEAPTFGGVIRERLASLGATGERWAAWKEPETGWLIKLVFTSDSIEHDARWRFEPRRNALAPTNPEAATLSQQDDMRGSGLIPRLRAVTPLVPDESRFDSDQFDYITTPASEVTTEPNGDTIPTAASGTNKSGSHRRTSRLVPPFSPATESVTDTARTRIPLSDSGRVSPPRKLTAVPGMARAEEPAEPTTQPTAELLETLRRRRGEREATLFEYDQLAASSAPVVPEGGSTISGTASVDSRPSRSNNSGEEASPEGASQQASSPAAPNSASTSSGPAHTAGADESAPATRGSKRGRASVPSWDEIVFGSKGDDSA